MEKLLNFFPSKKYNTLENRDAIIKFLIYAAILIYIFQNDDKMIKIIVILIIVTYIVFKLINRRSNEQFNCRNTTLENPLGNILLYDTDYDKKVCDNNEKIQNNLDYNVYYNSKDLFKKENNLRRQFIFMPSQTVPNDIQKFKENLYQFSNDTCKINSKNCMYNEDIRYHKKYFYHDQ
jgi:hypothetical protein